MSPSRKMSLIAGILLIIMVLLPVLYHISYGVMAYTNNTALVFMNIDTYAAKVFNLIFAVPYIIVLIMAFVGKRTMGIPIALLISGIVSALTPFVVAFIGRFSMFSYGNLSYLVSLAATVFITLFCAINMMVICSKQRYNPRAGLSKAYHIFTLVFIIVFAVVAFFYNIWRMTGGMNDFRIFQYPMIASYLPPYLVSIAFAVIWAFAMMLLVKWFGSPQDMPVQQGYPNPRQAYPGYQQNYPGQGYGAPRQAQPQADPRQAMYTQGINVLNHAVSEADYRRAQNIFFQLGDYRDSQEKKLYCKQRADELAQ